MPRDKIPPGQLKRLLDYNKARKADHEQADAGRVLADAIAAMPPGQRKQLLTEAVKAALATLGVTL